MGVTTKICACLISVTTAHVLYAAELETAPPFNGKIAVTVKESTPAWPQPVRAPEGAPNIVLILLDDVGFGAPSVFGGPAQTPALEQLAARGLRYNRFHVTALCSPTRAALLSGRNEHKVGFGTISELASGFPGYTAIWRKDAISIADVLRRNGYSTAAFGKWHNTPPWEISPTGPFDRWPTGLGFEYFYGFMGGRDSQWEPEALYRNTTPVDPPAKPEEGYHLTTDLADEAIQWVHSHQSLAPEKPYFLYFATGAAHEPHHVPREWIARYQGRFDQGWDKVREEIFARQKQLGVLPPDAQLTPRPKELPAWNSFSADQSRFLARQMEVYAAFLAHTDHAVGRLIEAAQRGLQGDNTLILYVVGDNGASAEGGLEGSEQGYSPEQPDLEQRLGHLDTLGSRLYNNNYAAAWAWAMNTPFQWMKQVASHLGGTRNPLIVSWPARIKDRGGIRSQYTHANDIAATIYEAVGIELPSTVDGVEQQPLDGTSLLYSFDEPSAPSRHHTQIFEQVGNRAIYRDGWVAAARHWLPWQWPYNGRDFEKDRWELYHIDEDFSQARDLAARNPEKLKELQHLFDVEARKSNVYPLDAGGWDWDVKHQPSPVAERTEFLLYYPGLPRVSNRFVPDFSESHRITAKVVIPDTGAQGVIMANGSRYGGFVLYVKDNHLVYESHSGDQREKLTSTKALPRGTVVLAYEFARERPKDYAKSSSGDPGTGRLYVNGQLSAEAKQSAVAAWGPLGIGRAWGSPVSSSFESPYKFTGTLKEVVVQR